MLAGVTKWSPILGGRGGEKMGLAFNLLEVNHKISVYYVD